MLFWGKPLKIIYVKRMLIIVINKEDVIFLTKDKKRDIFLDLLNPLFILMRKVMRKGYKKYCITYSAVTILETLFSYCILLNTKSLDQFVNDMNFYVFFTIAIFIHLALNFMRDIFFCDILFKSFLM